jgi:adenine-specific DNA-methyltransferase
MEYYFGFIVIMTAGGAFTLKQETVSEFPIKNISLSEQKPFITIVDKILAITKSGD